MRRYIGLKIDELEELATDNPGDPVIAEAILDELKHRRRTARVEALANLCIPATQPGTPAGMRDDAIHSAVDEKEPQRRVDDAAGRSAPQEPNAAESVFGREEIPVEPEQDSSPLARMRKRLLDLSSANRLLNFRHHAGTTVRVVDEVPGHVFERVVDDAKVMTFDPVVSDDADEEEEDEPQLLFAAEVTDPEKKNRSESRLRKAREAARRVGVNTSWDLLATQIRGSPRLGDSKLQTLLFPEDLEGILRRIDQKARSAINETGANMLHLMFGFVEWLDVPREQALDDSYRAAPLVLVPVALKKGDVDPRSGFRTYAVSSSGEAWDTNVTLVEKCRTEIGVALPRKREDEPLESYFSRVERWLAAHTSGWRLRRWVSLGLVSFGKILMWRDLDAENWPDEEGLLEHPLVRQFTGHEVGFQPLETGGEYRLDELHANGERVPDVVVEADSSQHSVLVDVAQGKNLVVQGPPGTGKSQTIVNLIADALASRRKVLFVAEKKAALDVVFKRLSDVGLGDFCLALHSHTSQKREFLEELGRRLEMRDRAWRPRRSLEELRAEIGAARDKLNAHVERLHRHIEPIGLSAFAIFGKAQRAADSLPPEAQKAVRDTRIPAAHSMTHAQLSVAKHAVKEYAAACGEVGGGTARELSQHPWAGVSDDDLTQAAIDDLVAAGRAWGECLRVAVATAQLVEPAARAGLPQSLSAFEQIEKTLLATEPDSALLSSNFPAAVCGAGNEAKVLDAVAAIETAVDAWTRVGRRWATHRRASDAHWLKIEKVVERAQRTFGAGATRIAVRRAGERAHALLQGVGGIAATATAAASHLGVTWEMTPLLAARLASLATSSLSLSADVFAVRTEALGDADCEPRLEDLTRRGADLVGKRSKLASAFPVATRPPIQRVREMIAGLVGAPRFLPSVFSGKYRRAVADFRIATGRRPPRSEMEAELRSLAALHDETEAFSAEPWLRRLFGTFSAGMDSPFLDARAARQWRITLERAASSLGPAGSALVEAGWIRERSAWRTAAQRFSEIEGRSVEAALADVEALETDLGVGPGALTGATFGNLEAKLRDISEAAASIEGVFSDGGFEEDLGIGAVAVALRAVGEARRRNRLAEPHEGFVRGLGVEPDDPSALGELRAAAKYVQALRTAALPRELVSWLCIDEVASRRARILDQVAGAVSAIRPALDVGLRFQKIGAVDWPAWTASTSTPTADLALADVRALDDRIERATRDEESLYSLARFLRARRYARAASAEQVCAFVEAGALGSEQAPDAFEAMALGTIANGVLRNDPDLDRFAGAAHEKVRERFAALDALMEKEFVEHLRYELLRTPAVQGVGTGPVDDLTDEGLIRHYASHPRGRITIRKVFERASNAVLALKPCFMMSPQAIAQYLAPGVFDFDLVVMDEASQIKPEDAMGAVARGRQLVVVGDPKQLGPTTFFERQAFDTDEDEPGLGPGVETAPAGPTEVDRSESILVASAARFPTRMLRWHYRSAHPKLIAFSNTKFYDGQLIVFPTPRDRVATDGVFFTRVQDAVYSGQKNEAEAAAVVEAVRRHARERPDRSLLVATLNFKQADLVDELLDRAEKDDEHLEAFRKRWADTLEPLDVKNLENVQGDERDAIIVSLTYGYDEFGKFHRRFGPINMVGGERRLNVLFTRAKHRVDVYCSFAPQDIGAGPSSPLGVKILQDYLRYASDGDWVTGDPSAREPDSEFEVAVAATLSRLGMHVHTQVGVHGYFIDLAVIDPRAPGTYLLGIECDGATYHSGRTARDRDRLRQKTLERFGWNIHRIWSTDWFRDPMREASRVAAKVKRLMEA